jgi:hypothetical protein
MNGLDFSNDANFGSMDLRAGFRPLALLSLMFLLPDFLPLSSALRLGER